MEVNLISSNILQAIDGAEMPTFKVNGVVGVDFTGEQLARVAEHHGEVKFIIDSIGGFASDAFHFYDYVRANALKVHVDGYGEIASAATIMMAAAGKKRSRIAPNAEYLIHNATGGDVEQVSRTNVKMARIYSELSGKSEKTILNIMKKDQPMSAEDAVNLGLVGSVIKLQKLAAKQSKQKDMSKENDTKRTFSVGLKEIVTGKIEIDMEMINNEVLTNLQSELGEQVELVKASTEKVNDLEASLKEATEKVTALEAEKVTTTATIEANVKDLDEVKASFEKAEGTIKAQLEEIANLKKDPAVKAELSEGDESQTPGKSVKKKDAEKGLTAAQIRIKKTAEALRKQREAQH